MELMDKGIRHLAVAVGPAAQGTALTRILALKTSPGWIVRQNDVEEWRYEGVREQDGTLYLYGPHVSGIPLSDIFTAQLAGALPSLARLAPALSLLAEKGKGWYALEADAVLFTEEAVLFLPPAIHREIRDMRTFESNRDAFECINHPDMKGEAQASFGIAAILYRVIVGHFPFTGPTFEEIHEQARKLAVTPPASQVPGLAAEVSELILAGLGRGRRGTVTLAEWATKLVEWQSREIFRPLSAEENARALDEAQAREIGSTKSFRRRMFWEKNWKLAAVVAAGVIIVGAVLGSILSHALAPRVTHGFTPRQVVNGFYSGMNSLDQTLMDACVTGKAGQAEINETTTLYVTSRVTQGYEGKSNIVSAAEWDRAGRPALTSPQTVFGVTGLSMTQEQDEPHPVFLVKYDMWNPASPPDTGKAPSLEAAPASEGHHVVDRVSLKLTGGDWLIDKIDRLSSDLLPPPQALAAPPSPPAR